MVVRHGQASYHSVHYDTLSELGRQQSYTFGLHLASLGQHWERVYLGPKKRHRQTMDEVARAYQAQNLPFPDGITLEQFDEHQGSSVVGAVLGEHKQGMGPGSGPNQSPEQVRAYFAHFQEITRRWVRCELKLEFETWQAFRARVVDGLQSIWNNHGQAENVLVFSSGGPVAVATGHALKLADLTTLELSWQVRNAAYASFLLSPPDRFSLESFNALPHFQRASFLTTI